ncbi:pyridoxal phosphate-dependent decarboxylase family protein [Marinovum sp.]|uniref:pyridoxal phosphate-dependent decarboxylase family protein n=1 Tax=Marinovum sp. TaxID=2024839 RepID=UPI002B27425A|nr:aminotransferase class V-fold PLP-dependent enzyme [Marinovum sp.]
MTQLATGLTVEERAALATAYSAALSYRTAISHQPARPAVGLDEAMERFRGPLSEAGESAPKVIEQITAKSEGALHAMTGPGFFGYVLGGSHPVGVAADALVSAWGQNAGSASETPAITGMERTLCDWLVDLFGLPDGTGAGLVTGASAANFCGVLAARHALLAAQGWDVEQDGLIGAPPIPVLIGAEAHSAVTAALRYSGLGAGRACRVATDEQGRIDPADFARKLALCEAPPLVILQAGQINTGGFDPFEALIESVHARGGWVHVDGAFGLWATVVPELAHLCTGVARADSWAVDLHKGLSAPFDAGVVLVRDRAALVAAMSARGAYLPSQNAEWEPSDSTPELSRRARGVPSYAILRHLGRAGVAELILRHHRLAVRIARAVAAEPGLTVANDVVFNQVAVCCGEGPAGDRLTKTVLRDVQARGKVYPSHGEWRGRQIIRISVSGYATGEAHADLAAQEIIAAWRARRDA